MVVDIKLQLLLGYVTATFKIQGVHVSWLKCRFDTSLITLVILYWLIAVDAGANLAICHLSFLNYFRTSHLPSNTFIWISNLELKESQLCTCSSRSLKCDTEIETEAFFNVHISWGPRLCQNPFRPRVSPVRNFHAYNNTTGKVMLSQQYYCTRRPRKS